MISIARRRKGIQTASLDMFEVKFVENTTFGQYVDTELFITGPFEMNIKISGPYGMSADWGRLFGVGNSSTAVYQYCQVMFRQGSTDTIWFVNGDGNTYIQDDLFVSRLYGLKLNNTDGNTTNIQIYDYIRNAVVKNDTINNVISYNKASVGSLYLFANNETLDSSGNSISSYPTKFTKYTLYGFDFKLNGNIVSNMIPYNVGGHGYLMDTVRGKLYGNGNLVPGPKKITNFNNEYVDFDLPSGLVWAKWDIGAEYEYDQGESYQWGALTPSSGTSPEIYDTQASGNLPLEKDIVNISMGGSWRMPTKEDYEELINNTTFTPNVTVTFGSHTITGCKFSKIINGEEKYIFLPNGGYNGIGMRWTSTAQSSSMAYEFIVMNDNPSVVSWAGAGKPNNEQVRGVCLKSQL